jgi:hypothetical protein
MTYLVYSINQVLVNYKQLVVHLLQFEIACDKILITNSNH